MARERRERRERAAEPEEAWTPKTQAGKLVAAGEITDIEQIYERNLPLTEHQIINKLVPNMEDAVLEIRNVQRMTDSGRRALFLVYAIVGNKDGVVGMGADKAPTVKSAIERAVKEAKRNVIRIRRGCGSWECGCGQEHSIPFKVEGKCGSTTVMLMPAPKGSGLVAGRDIAKVLAMAGVKDVWSKCRGNRGKTATVHNTAMATMIALKNLRRVKG